MAKDFGKSEREDIERLAAVRDAVGDDIEIYVDANNGYYAKQAIYMGKAFEEYQRGLVRGASSSRRHRRAGCRGKGNRYPRCDWANTSTPNTALKISSPEEARISFQPDVARVGGVTEWLKVAHLAHAFNLPVAPHAYQLIHLHLACATPNLKVVEYLGVSEESDRIYYQEISLNPRITACGLPNPDKPGLGLELDPVTVEQYAVGANVPRAQLG